MMFKRVARVHEMGAEVVTRWRAALARELSLSDRSQRQQGFTLVEIMVVVMIIGLLVGTVGVVAFNRFKKAQVKNAQTVVKNIEGAVEMYMMDNNGECPKDLEELRAEKIIKKDPKDPWGQMLMFKCPGERNTDGVDISSNGPDKTEGTDDDIKNWEE